MTAPRLVVVDVCCAPPVAGAVEIRCPTCHGRVWVPHDFGDPVADDDDIRALARRNALRMHEQMHETSDHSLITRPLHDS